MDGFFLNKKYCQSFTYQGDVKQREELQVLKGSFDSGHFKLICSTRHQTHLVNLTGYKDTTSPTMKLFLLQFGPF